MKSIGEHLNFHASALQLRSRRNDILASNIANAATPNFLRPATLIMKNKFVRSKGQVHLKQQTTNILR